MLQAMLGCIDSSSALAKRWAASSPGGTKKAPADACSLGALLLELLEAVELLRPP